MRDWFRTIFAITDADSILLKKRLLVVTCLLLAIGLVMVYSSSFAYAQVSFNDPEYYFKRQFCYTLLGMVAMLMGYKLDLNWLRRNSKFLMILALGLLFLVLLPKVGREVGGARRWFSLGPVNFQPSEFAQLVILIYSADLLARRFEVEKKLLGDIRSMAPVFITLGIMGGLILLEPDLGTTVVSAGAVFCMMLVAGLRFSYIIGLFVISLPVAWLLIFSASYRRARILSFLNPWADPLNKGYQIIQSQIALGSGGIWGRGLGKGLQKLFYLPAAHTDFIFAVIGEELGLIGTLTVLLLFFYLFIQGFAGALKQKDVFRKLLIVGIVSLLFIETTINLGVNLGLLPPKGLPLPFISYGGTSQVVNMFTVGLLINLI